MIRRTLLVLLLLLQESAFASGGADVAANAPAAVEYKSELLATIRDARRIVIVEHSNPLDVAPVGGRAPAPRPTRVYGVRTLDAAQRKYFLDRVSGLSPDLPRMVSFCAFVDHHTIYFFGAGTEPIKMEVCFECGDVNWTGRSRSAPIGLIGALSDVVKASGLSPTRDWRALMAKPRAD
jgi:hypothetical protein